jgi:hypothetical protein
MADVGVPESVTIASVPGGPVVVVPTAIVAGPGGPGIPIGPCGPAGPGAPGGPSAPSGMPKSRMAFFGVPTFSTVAGVPAGVVVVVPTVTVDPTKALGESVGSAMYTVEGVW